MTVKYVSNHAGIPGVIAIRKDGSLLASLYPSKEGVQWVSHWGQCNEGRGFSSLLEDDDFRKMAGGSVGADCTTFELHSILAGEKKPHSFQGNGVSLLYPSQLNNCVYVHSAVNENNGEEPDRYNNPVILSIYCQ